MKISEKGEEYLEDILNMDMFKATQQQLDEAMFVVELLDE